MKQDNYRIDALNTLGLKLQDTQDIYKIKIRFKQLSSEHSQNKQVRTNINIAYDALSDTYYKGNRYIKINQYYQIKDKTDIPFLILSNDFRKVKEYYDSKPSQINKILNPAKFSPLYLACRAGHYTIAEYFLMKGAKILKQQVSTPMHAACYFGHKKIIHLLYNYGIRADVRNDSNEYNGRFPIQQTQQGSQIYNMLKQIDSDKIYQLLALLKQAELTVDNLKVLAKNYKNYKQKIVCKKILNSYYQQNKNKYENDYETCFHGTKFEYIKSIFQNGLKPAGFKKGDLEIQLNSGHIDLSQSIYNVKNWGKAVFLSPSIFYAADPTYSEQIFSNGENWHTVIEAKVKKGCYTKHNHTFFQYNLKKFEPQSVQIRVSGRFFKKDDELLYISDGFQPVIVISVTFILCDYLSSLQNYKDTEIFQYNPIFYRSFEKQSQKFSGIKIIKRGNSEKKKNY